jgi:ribonuclease P protein component
MLPSSQRLRSSEVVEVLKRGRGLSSGVYLSAKALAAPQDATMRCAVIISKKIAKTAVMRNRIRRCAYDAFGVVANGQLSRSLPIVRIVFFVRSVPERSYTDAFTTDVITILRSLAAR